MFDYEDPIARSEFSESQSGSSSGNPAVASAVVKNHEKKTVTILQMNRKRKIEETNFHSQTFRLLWHWFCCT